ncbi:MAG TPA: tRNA (5-methylaminomethyl-2-thiouridine)(34)-methyltransferase MnmD [Flavobacterium sp.]|nr:tRNA (5-methylaminomethyl-2-thiouridine)(34)-methyltransferase MnmD [Flavobacterium sp.]
MQRKIIVTGDGSSSLLVEKMGETFHSRHGAVQESVYVYIENGLKKIKKKELSILEFGFGTGLNALLTANHALKHDLKIRYETVEAYPLTPEEYVLLNYEDFVQATISLKKLHEIPWNTPSPIILNNHFSILKHQQKIEYFSVSQKFDLIYFDVFGYDYQPELWQKEILQKAFDFLIPGGLFVTYACKGVVNRNLQEIGFEVHKLKGPPGKREMTLAVKNI